MNTNKTEYWVGIMDRRLDIANELIRFFQNHPIVKDAFLRGSLVNNGRDEYSDIDIGIDVSGYDNGKFAKELPELMQRNFEILFYDWSPSHLPLDYIITFIHQDFPIFWIIDIQIIATPHYSSLKEVPVNKYQHLLKLWILNLKYCLRGNEGCEMQVNKLYFRTFGKDIENIDSYYILLEIIREIRSNIEPELYQFTIECENQLLRNKLLFYK